MPFELSPERGRYALTLAIAEDKTFQLKDEIARMALPDLGYYKGNFFSIFPPGISILVLPFYLLGKMINFAQLAVFSVPAIFAVLNSILIFLILKKFEVRSSYAFIASLIFSFATTSWSYAVTLYQHHITTFLILSGFYYVLRFQKYRKLYWIWGLLVWLNYAVGLVIDSPNGLLLLPIMIYFLTSSFEIKIISTQLNIKLKTVIVYTIIPFLVIGFLYGYYNYSYFGDWFKIRKNLIKVTDIKDGNIISNEDTSVTPQKYVLGLFDAKNIPNGLYTLLVSNERGLFYYSPIMALALLGVISAYKKRVRETIILVSLISLNIFLYSAFGDPWGGWAFGPRYLIPSMAILSIFLGFAYHSIRSFWFRLISFPFIIYSVAVALLGALTTSQIPPRVEAIPLGIDYTYIRNLKFLESGQTGSFAYNYFFKNYLSLAQYWLVIFISIVILMSIFLFVAPYLERRKLYEWSKPKST